jgi:pectate lyase
MNRPRPIVAWTCGAALGLAAAYAGSQVLIPDFLIAQYVETFEDGLAEGWTTAGGTWAVVMDGTHVYSQSNVQGRHRALAPQISAFSNGTVLARVKVLGAASSTRGAGVLARVRDADNYYSLTLFGGNRVRLARVMAGNVQILAEAPVSTSTSTGWRTLRFDLNGTVLRGFVDGVPLVGASDGAIPNGRIGLETTYAAAHFDDVVSGIPR